MPVSGVISCSGPACARTRPARALYNPDGRHTYVGRFVRSAAYAYKMVSSYGSCCAGIHLWPALACLYVLESISFQPVEVRRSTKMSRYRRFLAGWFGGHDICWQLPGGIRP